MFALGQALNGRRRGSASLSAVQGAPAARPLVALLLCGALSAGVHFASLLVVPESSWFTLHMLLEFQVTRLVPFALYFALGSYAQTRGWFAGGRPLGSLPLWGAISAGAAVAYMWVGQPVFADAAGTAHFSVGLLLAYAGLRSLLLTALLVVLVSLGSKYWNRSRKLDRLLADESYSLYLTHYWVVVFMQMALLEWADGPAPVKATIVLLGALTLSLAISRWLLGRWPRGLAVAILALFAFCLAMRP